MLIVVAILALSFLIIVHELGHFAVAKWSDVKVLEFSLFMGPKLFSIKRGETLYSIRAIPLGGFVRMEGEEETSDDARAYNRKPLLTRAAVIIAGPVMNLVVAIIILVIIVTATGYRTTGIRKVEPTSPAYEAGLQAGDTILKYDNRKILHPADIYLFLFGSGGKPADVVIQRGNETKTIKITPEVLQKNRYILGFTPKESYGEGSNVIEAVSENPATNIDKFKADDKIIALNGVPVSNGREIRSFLKQSKGESINVTVLRGTEEKNLAIKPVIDNNEEQFDIGVDFLGEKSGIFGSVKHSIIYAASISRNVYYSFVWLITGRVSLSQLSGPVGIVTTIGDVVQQSPTFVDKLLNLFSLMAFIGINLGLFNLIPIPALDGSKLLFIAIEGIRKKAIPPEKEALISMVGFVLLIALMIFTTYNDILRKISGG